MHRVSPCQRSVGQNHGTGLGSGNPHPPWGGDCWGGALVVFRAPPPNPRLDRALAQDAERVGAEDLLLVGGGEAGLLYARDGLADLGKAEWVVAAEDHLIDAHGGDAARSRGVAGWA